MSKSNHTEAQMIGALKQLEAGGKRRTWPGVFSCTISSGTGELLIASHLVDGCAEVPGRESGETNGVKSFGLRFCSEKETNRGISADFAHGTPEGKEFLSVEQHARLIDMCLG